MGACVCVCLSACVHVCSSVVVEKQRGTKRNGIREAQILKVTLSWVVRGDLQASGDPQVGSIPLPCLPPMTKLTQQR